MTLINSIRVKLLPCVPRVTAVDTYVRIFPDVEPALMPRQDVNFSAS